MTYEEFLKEKIAIASSSGFSVAENDIHPILKPHQKDAVKWAIAGGCRAIFASFGLGKTIMQLDDKFFLWHESSERKCFHVTIKACS